MPDNNTKEATKKVKENAPTMNLLQKVMHVRLELSQSDIKKTGENKFQKYKYYELQDFLPKLIEFTDKYGVATMFNFNDTHANLILIDVDNRWDTWTFSVPVAELKLQGGQPIQNLGGQVTYSRRYLYMMAFDISEQSIVEGSKEDMSLEDEELEQIADAQTHEDLNVLCKALIKKKGSSYKSVILSKYKERKEELGDQNEAA